MAKPRRTNKTRPGRRAHRANMSPDLKLFLQQQPPERKRITWLTKLADQFPDVAKQVQESIREFARGELPGWSAEALRQRLGTFLAKHCGDCHVPTRNMFYLQLTQARAEHEQNKA